MKLKALECVTSQRKQNSTLSNNIIMVAGSANFASLTGFTFPGTLVGIKNTSQGTIDIHLTLSMEKVGTASETALNTINMNMLKQKLDVNTVNWHATYQTVVTLQIPSGSVSTVILGHTGLKFADGGSIGRAYDADLNTYGAWPTSRTELYKAGNYLIIDVYNASYS